MSQHINLDPQTGDYVLVGGQPQRTDSLTVPAYYRLKTKRTKWLYAPTDRFGSDFYKLKKNLSSDSDVSRVEDIAARALAPMVEDGRASSITVEVVQRERFGLCLSVKITAANGEEEEFLFTGIGVR